MNYDDINDLLCAATVIRKRKNIYNKSYTVNNLSIQRLRDTLYKISRIQAGNLKQQYYIVTINAGFAKKNSAVLVVQLQKDTLRIAAYANEGIIKQHTSEGATNELYKALKEYIGNEIN